MFLLLQVDWCFGDGSLAELKASIPENMNSVPELESASTNQNLLLGNIRKVEGLCIIIFTRNYAFLIFIISNMSLVEFN